MAGCQIPQKYTLDCLVKKADNPCVENKHCEPKYVQQAPVADAAGCGGYGGRWNACSIIVWWIIIAIIVGFILFLFRPAFLLGRDHHGHRGDYDRDGCYDDCNWGSLIVWSLVISLGLIILFWLISCFCGGGAGFY